MNDKQATIQIVWETLNGLMYDLQMNNLDDATETVENLIEMLEQSGANPE